MNQEQSRARPPLYTQIDVSQSPYHPPVHGAHGHDGELVWLMRQMLAGVDRQNELLEELVGQVGASHRQRANDLGQWKEANPHLARNCRRAANALSKIHAEFLDSLTREINANCESLMEGDFALNEFVDRFGPRMAHLNGILQLLSQLSATPNPASTPNVT